MTVSIDTHEHSIPSTHIIADVVNEIKAIIREYDGRLTHDERNFLSVGYKNLANTCRNSWRIVDALERQTTTRANKGLTRPIVLMRLERTRIEKDLTIVCLDVVNLLDKELLPNATMGEETVFYHKMCVFSGETCSNNSLKSSGKEIITVIWPSLPGSKIGRNMQTFLCRRTNLPTNMLYLLCIRSILRGLGWHSTSQFFTTVSTF